MTLRESLSRKGRTLAWVFHPPTVLAGAYSVWSTFTAHDQWMLAGLFVAAALTGVKNAIQERIRCPRCGKVLGSALAPATAFNIGPFKKRYQQQLDQLVACPNCELKVDERWS